MAGDQREEASGRLPTSERRFPDGRAWRIEIPSVEGPAAMEAVIAEADARQVPVHRVSQGSGMMLLLDSEITAMVEMGAEREIEVCLFVGPRGSFDVGASARSDDGAALRSAVRGQRQLTQALAEVERAAELGVRSVLVGDIGLLAELGRRRRSGRLPADFRLKVSALAAPANPSSYALLSELGANSINVHSDHSLPELAEFRAAGDAVLDVYVEAPDSLGGFVRYPEIAEFVRVAAPIHLKFGLRNAPSVYPSGAHLAAIVESAVREKVRRAQIGLEYLQRAGSGDGAV